MLILWQSHPSLMLILCQTSTEWDTSAISLSIHRWARSRCLSSVRVIRPWCLSSDWVICSRCLPSVKDSKSSVPDAYPLTESSVWVTHLLSGPSWWGAAQCSSWCSSSGRAIRPWCLYSVRHQLSEMLVSNLCALSIAVSEWLIRQTRMITVVNLIIFLHYYLAPWGLRWK
jgi:hypothetical protein